MALTYLINGKIILENEVLEGFQLQIEDGKIAAILKADDEIDQTGAEVIDLNGGYISPGWIDIHSHGAVGADFTDGDIQGTQAIVRFAATQGVTGIIPTGITNPFSEIEKAVWAVAETAKTNTDGAQILGFHMEGPFICEKRKGAHRAELLVPADATWTRKIRSIIPGQLIVAVAPEVPGNLEYIREMAAEGVKIALGHTDATYAEIQAAVEAGATHGVHTFNAMRELHHREPGVVGAIMDLPLVAEAIVDGIHIHPAVVRILSKLKLPDKFVLITDAIRATGLSDGEYDLGGQQVVKRGKEARLADGTLAGSTLTMQEAVQNAVSLVGLSITDAVRAAATNPAKLLGLDTRKGSIAVGKDADLTLLSPELTVMATIIDGRVVYRGW